jgi:hypothetical protein
MLTRALEQIKNDLLASGLTVIEFAQRGSRDRLRLSDYVLEALRN